MSYEGIDERTRRRRAVPRRARSLLAVGIGLALAVPASSPAQAAAVDPATADLLDRTRIVLEPGFWGDSTLFRGGVEVDFGYFCGECAAIFAGSPAALDAVDTLRTMRFAGVPLYVVGLGALVADLIGLAVAPHFFLDLENGAFYSLLIGGTVVGMTGGILMGGSGSYLGEAVNRYNDDLFAAARQGRTLPVSVSLAPRPGGLALGLAGAF
jgi:hypothetical protein